MTLAEDIRRYATIAIRSRARRGMSTTSYLAAVATSATSHGLSRAEVQHRLARYHGTDWTLERVTAVMRALVERGVLSDRSGYRVRDWDAMQALASEVAA